MTGDLTSREMWESGVLAYWEELVKQSEKQGQTTGVQDTGNRKNVTGGKQMERLQAIVAAIWISDPDVELTVRAAGRSSLPAYFRPTKDWDLTVFYRGALVAAMEFKSHRGPSFGNNFNNRTEEALGLAADSQMAVERGLFGQLKPWFGFFMLVEHHAKSTTPVRLNRTPFPVDQVFKDTSYLDRYRIFFERMITEGNYDAATLVSAAAGEAEFIEPSIGLSVANLEAAIRARITYIKTLPDDLFDQMTPDGQLPGFS